MIHATITPLLTNRCILLPFNPVPGHLPPFPVLKTKDLESSMKIPVHVLRSLQVLHQLRAQQLVVDCIMVLLAPKLEEHNMVLTLGVALLD